MTITIEFLEKKRKELNIREMEYTEREKLRDEYNKEIQQLLRMKYYYNK